MPVVRNMPDSKRRSRMGCMPCRKRRRKCDEKRPKCGNCEARNVACEYKEWTFVPGVRSSPSSRDTAVDDTVDNSSLTLFTPDNTLSATKPSSPPPLHDSPQSITFSTRGNVTQTIAFDNSPASIAPPQESNASNEITSPSKWNDPVLTEQILPNRQAAMLRFRYKAVPWLESSCPKSLFGPRMMTMAREKPAIMDAMICLANHQNRDNAFQHDLDGGSKTRQDITDRLLLEDAFTADVGRSLLALCNLFNGGPSQWIMFPFYCPGQDMPYHTLDDKEEPLRTLLRFHIKIGKVIDSALEMQANFQSDLAASIMTNKPPSMKLPLSLNRTFFSPSLSSVETYGACLSCLVDCLRLIHYELIPLLTNPPASQPAARESYSLKWAAWSSLWTTCMQWFQDRPPGMEPVLESPDVDASQDSPFPADIYTSVISLQANLTIHLSSLLLLAYKPRLIKLSRFPHRLISRSWHVQKIARLAVWNTFSEQWDPIAVAALLRISREMTHASQQEALLSCFQRITDSTSMTLESEIRDLRLYWHSSSHSSPPNIPQP
ncbi:hypothetical protein ACJZ2D_004861 [Fusarium nematophilum]